MALIREVKGRPNSDAIRKARQVCREIESGEVMSAGWVLVKRGGDVITGWDMSVGHTHEMLSGAALLAHRLTVSAHEGSE